MKNPSDMYFVLEVGVDSWYLSVIADRKIEKRSQADRGIEAWKRLCFMRALALGSAVNGKAPVKGCVNNKKGRHQDWVRSSWNPWRTPRWYDKTSTTTDPLGWRLIHSVRLPHRIPPGQRRYSHSNSNQALLENRSTNWNRNVQIRRHHQSANHACRWIRTSKRYFHFWKRKASLSIYEVNS